MICRSVTSVKTWINNFLAIFFGQIYNKSNQKEKKDTRIENTSSEYTIKDHQKGQDTIYCVSLLSFVLMCHLQVNVGYIFKSSSFQKKRRRKEKEGHLTRRLGIRLSIDFYLVMYWRSVYVYVIVNFLFTCKMWNTLVVVVVVVVVVVYSECKLVCTKFFNTWTYSLSPVEL